MTKRRQFLQTAGTLGLAPLLEDTGSLRRRASTHSAERKYYDGFEDGALDGWSEIVINSGGLGEWYTTENAISGDQSLRVETVDSSVRNILATDQFIIDLSRDFELSLKWMSEDPNNRGIRGELLAKSRNQFPDIVESDAVNVYEPNPLFFDNGISWNMGADAISNEGSPFKGKGHFNRKSITPNRPSLETGVTHTVTIVKRGSMAEFHIDGSQLAESEVATEGEYRLALMSSGTWGKSSSIIIDDVSLIYTDSDSSEPGSKNSTSSTTQSKTTSEPTRTPISTTIEPTELTDKSPEPTVTPEPDDFDSFLNKLIIDILSTEALVATSTAAVVVLMVLVWENNE